MAFNEKCPCEQHNTQNETKNSARLIKEKQKIMNDVRDDRYETKLHNMMQYLSGGV